MTSLCPRVDYPTLPSPSSSPFRPFSQLPIEVIRNIVDSTAPSHYHPDTYPERQSTLRSLCLTSRLFCQLAKPLLYAVVRLSTRDQINAFRDTEQARAKEIETREFFLDGQAFGEQLGDLYVLLATNSSLRKIELCDFETEIDLSQFARLKSESASSISYIALFSC